MNRMLFFTMRNFQKLEPLSRLKTVNKIAAPVRRSFASEGHCRSLESSPNRSKTKTVQKVTVIGRNQSVSVMSLEEAQKLAKRRDLHLVQVQDFDPKTQRAVYKLEDMAELISGNETETGKDKQSRSKSEKMVTISSNISDHDLSLRLRNISKWMTKRCHVRVFIQGKSTEMGKCEKIFTAIEKSLNVPTVTGKIDQKTTKSSTIKLHIVPVEAATAPPA